MNMSLRDIYYWLAGLDFPSLLAIWNWLITVPWWLAIGTVIFIVFAVRITWALTTYSFKWLADKMFGVGERLNDWLRVIKFYKDKTLEFGRTVKRIFF